MLIPNCPCLNGTCEPGLDRCRGAWAEHQSGQQRWLQTAYAQLREPQFVNYKIPNYKWTFCVFLFYRFGSVECSNGFAENSECKNVCKEGYVLHRKSPGKRVCICTKWGCTWLKKTPARCQRRTKRGRNKANGSNTVLTPTINWPLYTQGLN